MFQINQLHVHEHITMSSHDSALQSEQCTSLCIYVYILTSQVR